MGGHRGEGRDRSGARGPQGGRGQQGQQGSQGGRGRPPRSRTGAQRRGRGGKRPSATGPRAGRGPSGRQRVDSARLVALETLTKVRRDAAFANLVLPVLLNEAGLNRRDAGFATALTYGTLRLQGRYDAVLAQCVDRPLDQLDGVVHDVLRLGAHQLLGMRVASHAAVSATVELAIHAAGRGAAGLVNAVLRRVDGRDVDSWLERLEEQAPDEIRALADCQSHPVWIVKAFRQALRSNGRDEAELAQLLEADNADPEVVLCARPGLITPEQLAKEARASARAEARPGDLSPYALVLPGSDPGRIASVRSSRAGVEDQGSQLVALMLSEAPLTGRDEYWLDLCAGPGGKAALLGARAAQRGAGLVANEVAPHRAELVAASTRALPDGVVEIRCADGRDYGRDEPGHYDRVLVDAPCSGLGSLRRRPEARWRRTPRDVSDLAGLQRELVASALGAVRRGGLVAYVTCSPHVMETELVVGDALRRLQRDGIRAEVVHAGDVATRVAPRPPAGADRPMVQLWPHLDGTDAMFCALLRRTH